MQPFSNSSEPGADPGFWFGRGTLAGSLGDRSPPAGSKGTAPRWVSGGQEAQRMLRHEAKQELSYRKQIARQLRTQYAQGIYDNPMTLKFRLTVT